MKITFVLPGRGGGGGAHSVVQEGCGLQRLGAEVAIATNAATAASFRATYPELDHNRVATPVFSDADELAGVLAGADFAVATTAPSANLLADALARLEGEKPRAAYYVQDYEPLFFTPGTREWDAARRSYSVLPDALLFAKTEWLCWMVEQNHNRAVVRVLPSIDHATFHPQVCRDGGPTVISAMIRPKTPRRAPLRTARVLERIAAEFGEKVQIVSFGCDEADLATAGLKLSGRIDHNGVLSRSQVAAVLRASDLFLDLSDYQAFGRTALEGMACGCVPIAPLFGGSREFARHGENAFMVDTRSDAAVLEAVRQFVGSNTGVRAGMRRAAIETALDYSIEKAAFSEYEAFARHAA